MEDSYRSQKEENLKKVIIWRILSFIVSSLITWAYLGELKKSLVLSVILVVVMTTIHFFFETIWDRHYKFKNWHKYN